MAKKDFDLKTLSDSMADAVEKAGAAAVLVNARRRFPATGVAYAADLILTADHVVQRDEDIKVILPDGSELSAEVAGRDPGSDLCLLRLEKAAATPAEKAAEPRPGQLALALGRPTAEGVQASLGIVSAVGGPTRTRRGGMLERYIRTDAIPYPGFSGGPLIDADGKVLGINTSGLGHGNSITIPAELAWKIAASLAEHGSVKRGFLGIRSQPVEIPAEAQKTLGREQETGLLLVGIEPDSPAAEAGLIVSDILIGFNDQPVETPDELLSYLTGDVVGNATPVEVLRGGKPKTLKVTVSERPQPTSRRRRGSHRGRRRAFWMGKPGMHGRPRKGHQRGPHFEMFCFDESEDE
jgi:S1-C subfamily serine protease